MDIVRERYEIAIERIKEISTPNPTEYDITRNKTTTR